MQGWGTIAGHQFFFRARWDRWTFAIAESPDVDPVDIYSTEQGFYKEEPYANGPYDAGYMPRDEAEAIVRRCAREYLTRVRTE